MNLQQPIPTLLVLVGFALLGATGLLKLPSVAAGSRSAGTDGATQAKIARAMSAGPHDIARSARIIDTDANQMATSPIPATSPATAPKVVEHPSRLKPAWQKYGTPLIVLLLAIAIIVTITPHWNGWEGGRVEQVTNDAYVRGDLTPRAQGFRAWSAR